MILSYNFKEWSLHWHFSVCVASKLCSTRRILLLHVLGTVTFVIGMLFKHHLQYIVPYQLSILTCIIVINLIYGLTSPSTRPWRNQHEKMRGLSFRETLLGRQEVVRCEENVDHQLYYIGLLSWPCMRTSSARPAILCFYNPSQFGRLILSMRVAGWVTAPHVRGRQSATSSPSIVEKNDLL
jgi:hypothetical protein